MIDHETSPPPPNTMTPASGEGETADEPLRLLLIDDSEIALAIHQEALAKAGFDVRGVQTIGEFDVLFKTWSPHLILSDVQMPGMGGGELCKTMKARFGAQVPFVLLSDLPEPKLRQIATEAGADGYVSKSQETSALVHHVKVYCAMAYSPDRVRL
jgi:CheY-like chemotaxis protein